MHNDVVLSGEVRLARNFADIPFDAARQPESAAGCVTRTMNALQAAGCDRDFRLFHLDGMSQVARQALAESGRISREAARKPENMAVLLCNEDTLSVTINDEDHLRILCTRPEMDLDSAANACYRVDDCLSRRVQFAYDEELGFLTASPANAGTGLRASLVLHLPELARCGKLGSVAQLLSKVGMTIEPVYGADDDAPQCVHRISNRATLGCTETELIGTVNAMGNQLCDMEHTLRERFLRDERVTAEDMVFRAWGLMSNARRMSWSEFIRHWSNLRLGVTLGLVQLPLRLLDDMPARVGDAHLCAWAEETLTGAALHEARATCVREMLVTSP